MFFFSLSFCRAVKNASSNSAVRFAVDGIEAYKNITDVIKAAEDAANRAKEAADNALNVSFTTGLWYSLCS